MAFDDSSLKSIEADMEALRDCYDSSKKYKLHFVMAALSRALEGLDSTPFTLEGEIIHEANSIWWIYDAIEKDLGAKLQTENKTLLHGLLIDELRQCGAKVDRSSIAIGEWLLMNDSTPKQGYHDYQRLKKSFGEYNTVRWKKMRLKAFIESQQRPFPKTDIDVFNAFQTLVKKLGIETS